MISAFTCQFSRQFPAYREILEQITPPDPTTPPEARFKMLVTDPLLACEDRLEIGSPWIVVLDGLDEAAASGGTAMIDFIAESVERFPPWFRVIITARPDQELLDRFQGINIRRMILDASSIDNLVDIEEYIQLRGDLKGLNNSPEIVNRIKNLIAGNFLSAKTILDALIDAEPTNPVIYEYPGKLPPALCRIYEKMFRRRFADRAIYSNEFAPLVACLASSRKPVPESILISACGVDQRSTLRRLSILSQFLTRTEDNFSFFHPSLVQWLTNDPVQNPYAVSTQEGCRRLAEACLQDIREKGGVISDFTRENLPYYLAGAKMFDILEENLRDARFIEGIANKGREEFMEVWSYVEQSSPLRIRAVYAPVIESPYGYDPSVLGHIAALLEKRGHHDGALALYREQGQIYQKQKNIQRLQESLWDQGHTLRLIGDEDSSMALFKEQERICRTYGLHHGLQLSLIHI